MKIRLSAGVQVVSTTSSAALHKPLLFFFSVSITVPILLVSIFSVLIFLCQSFWCRSSVQVVSSTSSATLHIVASQPIVFNIKSAKQCPRQLPIAAVFPKMVPLPLLLGWNCLFRR